MPEFSISWNQVAYRGYLEKQNKKHLPDGCLFDRGRHVILLNPKFLIICLILDFE